MENKKFMNVNEVAEFMGVSVGMAYKIIHKLNEDLKKKGYITVAGRVNSRYFKEKVYCA